MADILSGCYWSDDPSCPEGNPQAGYIYVLAGTDDGSFNEATPLVNSEKKPLTNVPLSQEKLENYDTNNIEFGNICTAQFAADYDGDGDLDLIVGEMGSRFYVHLNSANSSSAAPVFAEKPIVLDVKLPSGSHSDPHFVDWDGDGDLDLLSGSGSGSVYLSVNEGTVSEPKWAEFMCLIENESIWLQTIESDSDLKPGHGSRVCVADFNRDGKLDVILGDATTIEKEIPGLTTEEAARLEREYDEEMQPIRDELDEIREKLTKDYEKAKENGEENAYEKFKEIAEEATKECREKMTELRKKEKLFRDNTMTGHVWVYLQK